MKQITTTLILLVLTCSMLLAQQKKAEYFERKFSAEIEKELAEGKLRFSSAAYDYTYIGNYSKALEKYESHLNWGLDTMTYEDSIRFTKYRPIPAKEYLAERLQNEQIVIISEAHQKPQHRVFTAELLEMLYENGFRYLGMEAIMPSITDSTKYLMDTLLMERGYPINSRLTGGYVREPQMGNLVRKALDLGFMIFGYERTNKDIERDLRQAMNIEKFMNAHPDGKVVIHCGWYHAIESDYTKHLRGGKKGNYMAHHLKNRTGIDPLTIYQDVLSEKVLKEESPYYQMIDAEEMSVLVNDKGEVFNGVDEQSHFDILLYHPRTKYIKNRPDWLVKLEGNRFVEIKKQKIKPDQYPVLVEAREVGEKNSVPLDIIELIDANDETPLVLKKGHYTISITDKNRTVQTYKIKAKRRFKR